MRKKLIVMADIITLLMMTGCGGFTTVKDVTPWNNRYTKEYMNEEISYISYVGHSVCA